MKFKIKFFSKKDVKLLKQSFVYIKPYKIRFLLLFLSIFLSIIFGLAQPWIWGKILQCLFKQDYKSIYNNIIYLFIIYMLNELVVFVKAYSYNYLNNNIMYDLRMDMYKKIINLPMKTFDGMKVGEFISRIEGDVSTLADILTNQLLNAVLDILRIAIISIAVFKINVILAILAISTLPISYILFLFFGKFIRGESKKFKVLSDKYYSVLEQSLHGIKYIKTYGIKKSNYNFFSEVSRDTKNKGVYISLLNIISQVLSDVINYINEIIVIGVGIYLIYKGRLNIQGFVAFTSYSKQLLSSLQSITSLNATIQKALISLERIFDVINNLTFSSEAFGTKHLAEVKGIITFENVCFSYDSEKYILKNLNFKITGNKLTAIVGKNGSGKSTIFSLLSRLYVPSSGSILIDTINIREINEESLRKSISVVHQQPFLFNFTIKENFKLVAPQASDSEIEQACKSAYIYEYIMSLEKKIDTIINESANNLSGGQKQRMALAMCILRDSSIILLDEATSALDTESQCFIRKSIKNLSKTKTVIMITHQLADVVDADEIFVLDNGRIRNYGSHDSLINKNLEYII